MSTKRLSKQLRTIPLQTHDEERSLYLDTVPDEILRSVLRYLFRRPQNETWHAYVSADLESIALDVGGALGRTALMEFYITEGKRGIPPGTTLDMSILLALAYRIPLRRLASEFNEEAILPALLRGSGAELRELDVCTEGIVLTENDILAIATQCTKLCSLTIRDGCIAGVLAPIYGVHSFLG